MSEQPLIAVLDYGIGNLRSAQKALQRCGADARLTVDHGLITDADAVVLPGVGAFGACMAALREADLEDAVEGAVDSGRPFLGICVGMQMLFDASEEDDSAVGLGVIPGVIGWLGSELPRPQMQWNLLTLTMPDDQMFAGFEGVILNFPNTGRRGFGDRRTEEELKKASEKATATEPAGKSKTLPCTANSATSSLTWTSWIAVLSRSFAS